MQEYSVHYPKWLIMAQLVFVGLFSAYFIHQSIKQEIWFFTLFGFIFFLFASAILIYTLKTGRYPVSFRRR